MIELYEKYRLKVCYRRCVCDRCGMEERIDFSGNHYFPDGWTTVGLDDKQYDFCKSCSAEISKMVDEVIRDNIEKHKEQTAE